MTTNDAIEQRLTAILEAPLSAGLRERIDERVNRAVAAEPAGWRVPLRRHVLLLVTLLIAVPLVAAAGAAFSTEAPFGMGDADAYEAELAAAKAATPLPPGATWPPYLDRAEDRTASYGTGLGQSMVEINAYCLWLGYWYEAQEAGDTEAVSAALATLNDARSWTTLTNELSSDQAFRDNIQARIDAAHAGDAGLVLDELQLNCSGVWPPTDGG